MLSPTPTSSRNIGIQMLELFSTLKWNFVFALSSQSNSTWQVQLCALACITERAGLIKHSSKGPAIPGPFPVFAYTRSYSVIRHTVFFKKFLISTKNYGQSLGASYRRIFSRNNFFYHSYWYDFKQIKGYTVLVIDFYKYGGSEKTSEVKFA